MNCAHTDLLVLLSHSAVDCSVALPHGKVVWLITAVGLQACWTFSCWKIGLGKDSYFPYKPGFNLFDHRSCSSTASCPALGYKAPQLGCGRPCVSDLLRALDCVRWSMVWILQ